MRIRKNEHQILVLNSVGVQSIDKSRSSSCLGRVQPGGDPGADPGHAGEIVSRRWSGAGEGGRREGGLGITARSKISEELFIKCKNDIQHSVDVTGIEKEHPKRVIIIVMFHFLSPQAKIKVYTTAWLNASI